ncbi:MAG: hypothetical protein M1839_004818 [Geoglossum umbratile]|nr:MAG: hypothetical protein M1839_004818 [Geoglossum umbratile]
MSPPQPAIPAAQQQRQMPPPPPDGSPPQQNTQIADIPADLFRYDPESSTLSWHCPPEEPVQISGGAVIAVLRDRRDDVGGGYTVLYVDAAGGFQSQTLNVTPPFLDAHPPVPRTPPSHLLLPPSPEGRPNIHILISTLSGTETASAFCTTALLPLLNYLHIPPFSYKTHSTSSASSIAELGRSIFLPAAQRGEKQTVILLSGDGGVLDLVNVLNPEVRNEGYTPPVLSLHPLGTGNALASSLTPLTGSDHTLALSTLLRGHPHPLPLLRATFSPGARLLTHHAALPNPPPSSNPRTVYGTVLLSSGFHATLVADSDTPAYRAHGASRFLLAAQNLLFPTDGTPPHAYKARLTIYPSRPLPDPSHAYILATLVPRLEKTFTISPASAPLDGRLWLVRFGPVAGEAAMRLMQLAYADGKHVDDPAVTYEEIEGLRIDFEEEEDRWRRVCVDGTIVLVEEGGWAEVWRDQRSTFDILVDPRSLAPRPSHS